MAEPFSEAQAYALIAYMRGFWPPLEHDGEVIRAWRTALKGITWEEAVQAIEWIGTNTQREFAPTPGIVRARVLNARPADPPPTYEELEPAPAVGKADGTRDDGGWTDEEGFEYFPDGRLDVPVLIAKMKADLAEKATRKPKVAGFKRVGEALDSMYEQQR